MELSRGLLRRRRALPRALDRVERCLLPWIPSPLIEQTVACWSGHEWDMMFRRMRHWCGAYASSRGALRLGWLGSTNLLRHRRDHTAGTPGLNRCHRYLRAVRPFGSTGGRMKLLVEGSRRRRRRRAARLFSGQPGSTAGGANGGWIPGPPPPLWPDRTILSGQTRAGWSCWRTGPGATPRDSECTARMSLLRAGWSS